MHEGIRSACCNHYENKALLSVSNMNLLIVGIQLVENKHVQLYRLLQSSTLIIPVIS